MAVEKMTMTKVMIVVLVTSLFWIGVDIFIFSIIEKYQNSEEQSLRSNSNTFPIDHHFPGLGKDIKKEGLLKSFFTPNKVIDQIRELFVPKISTTAKIHREKYILNALRFKPSQKPKTSQYLNKMDFERQIEDTGTTTPVQLIFEKVRGYNIRTLPYDPKGHGEDGRGVNAGAQFKQKVDAGYKHASFNEFVSDSISVERSIPDVRSKSCKESQVPYNALPKASVIICFTEESWSTLLRTIHSVINRSPPELLEEIILVDDFSQRVYLKKPLDEYVNKLEKVKILRLPKREGLIRARMAGTIIAKGKALVFLDSHIECMVGWLEPMLERLRIDKRNVVAPVIDNISMDNFAYYAASESVRGIFKWNMEFHWGSTPNEELRKRKNDAGPIKSPTMAGGLFAIDKSYFLELGMYDPGLNIWGGENLELSFKIWQCGGRLEIHPCSHVGHVFRNTQPYKFPGGIYKTLLRNLQRIAETWLDEYKELFYQRVSQLRGQNFGDITERTLLKKKLKCKSFDWYLDNVYPEMYKPDMHPKFKGEIRNVEFKEWCLDIIKNNARIKIFPCHGQGGKQLFSLSRSGQIENSGENCIDYDYDNYHIRSKPCGPSTKISWKYNEETKQMIDTATYKCLDVDNAKYNILNQCDEEKDSQKWNFGSVL